MSIIVDEIIVSDGGRKLRMRFENGKELSFDAEFLRVESPSAEVQGHSKNEKVLVSGKSNVRISNAELVGHYAVRLLFSDGHATGIFTWQYLLDISENYSAMWNDYLTKLSAAGLSR
jgi:DUF971 family protein